MKLQTWKDYFCNPSILPFGRLKQEDDEFWGQHRFQRKKKKICDAVQSCYFWGNLNRTIHPNQSLKKLYTKKTKEVGSSYWKKNEGVKQGKFLRIILTALAPREKPICSFLGMCECGSMHAGMYMLEVNEQFLVLSHSPVTWDLCLSMQASITVCTTVNNFFFHMGPRDQTWVQAKHFSNEVNCSSCLFYACLGTPDSSNS